MTSPPLFRRFALAPKESLVLDADAPALLVAVLRGEGSAGGLADGPAERLDPAAAEGGVGPPRPLPIGDGNALVLPKGGGLAVSAGRPGLVLALCACLPEDFAGLAEAETRGGPGDAPRPLRLAPADFLRIERLAVLWPAARGLGLRALELEARALCAGALARVARIGGGGEGSAGRDRGGLELAERARRRLEAGLAEPPSLAALAAELGVTPEHLARAFRARYGTSPIRFQRALRIEAAERLLRAGASVKEASWELGFASPFHFSRVFKAERGASPSAWLAASKAAEGGRRGPSGAPAVSAAPRSADAPPVHELREDADPPTQSRPLA